MPRRKIQRAFLSWLEENRGRLELDIRLGKRTDTLQEFSFAGINGVITGALTTFEIDIWVIYRDECWDLLYNDFQSATHCRVRRLISTIPWFDRRDHPFVPTCPPAERRAQRKSPRRGRSEAKHRAVARLTERARRYPDGSKTKPKSHPSGLEYPLITLDNR